MTQGLEPPGQCGNAPSARNTQPQDPAPGLPALSDDDAWSALIDGMSAAFLLTDPQLRVVRWNPAAERMYRFPTAEVLGRSVYDLWIPRWSTRLVDELRQRLAGGESWTGNLWMQRGDGTEVLARGTRAPVVDGSGRVVGAYAMTYDVHGARADIDPLTQAIEPRQPLLEDAQRITVLPTSRRALIGSTEIALTRTEFTLLELLVAERNQVVTVDALTAAVWGHPAHGDRGFLQAHISRIRAKLRAAGAPPDTIEAIRGIGYLIRD